MKLNWKRAGCASIAEWRGFTFICEWIGKNMSCDMIIRGIDGTISVSMAKEDITSAEDYCESWLEQHDHPEWHDVTDWLSWAEWRGFKFYIRTTENKWYVYFIDIYRDVIHPLGSRDEAKAAAEKWVREQGEKA